MPFIVEQVDHRPPVANGLPGHPYGLPPRPRPHEGSCLCDNTPARHSATPAAAVQGAGARRAAVAHGCWANRHGWCRPGSPGAPRPGHAVFVGHLLAASLAASLGPLPCVAGHTTALNLGPGRRRMLPAPHAAAVEVQLSRSSPATFALPRGQLRVSPAKTLAPLSEAAVFEVFAISRRLRALDREYQQDLSRTSKGWADIISSLTRGLAEIYSGGCLVLPPS